MPGNPERSSVTFATGTPALPSGWRALLLSFPPAYVALQVGGWLFYAMANFLFFVLYGSYPRKTNVLLSVLLFSLYGLLTTHYMRALADRQRWADKRFIQLAPRALAAATVSGILLSGSLVVINSWLLRLFTLDSKLALTLFITVSFNAGIVVLLWEFFYFLAKTIQRKRSAEMRALRLELLARDAQYRSLSSQLQPHFLFNCLNSLRALIAENPARARDMVTELAVLLRYSLHHDLTERVTLKQEMAALDHYLSLEVIRFEERLRIRYDVPSDLRQALLPPMIVQTLAENAIKHGIATRREGGEITILASQENGSLRIDVVNDGQLASGDQQNKKSLGLRNARERLELSYGLHASLELFQASPQKVCARLRLPLEYGVEEIA